MIKDLTSVAVPVKCRVNDSWEEGTSSGVEQELYRVIWVNSIFRRALRDYLTRHPYLCREMEKYCGDDDSSTPF